MKKDTSYKLALLRAFNQIAKNEPHIAYYHDKDDLIYIPLKRLAFYWLLYYFPIIKNHEQIRQSRTHGNLAFEKIIRDLHEGPSELGYLVQSYEDGNNIKVIDPILKKISSTIKDQPMRYAGDDHYSVFRYLPENSIPTKSRTPETKDGLAGINGEMWMAFTMFGHWIEDSLIIQWAKFTEAVNKDENFAVYLKLLDSTREDERTTKQVHAILAKHSDIECVWSGNIVNTYQIDHAIPFSIWKNNDLWNLLPVESKLNLKKSDCIPHPDLVKKRKDAIIFYWRIYADVLKNRFAFQIRKALGTSVDQNWESNAFLAFYEIICRMANHNVADTFNL